jgi:hypothetical protein
MSEWRKRFSFCVIRNPFDKAISLFEYWKRIKYLPNNMTFGEFLNKDDQIDQLKFCLDENQCIIISKIYKFEDGIENVINDLNQKFPHLNIKIEDNTPKNANPNPKGRRMYFTNDTLINNFVTRYNVDFMIGNYSQDIDQKN